MKVVKPLPALFLSAALLAACVSPKLEPVSPEQKVPNKPNAAAAEVAAGVRLQVEANSWMADERVKNEVTAMKVTVINHGTDAVRVEYSSFALIADDEKSYRPVAPADIPIRGTSRSIGLPADTIVTRSSDSAVNRPDREENEKDDLRQRLMDQALKSGQVPAGERSVGYVYFERIPAGAETITFRGTVKNERTGKTEEQVKLEFRPRQYQ